MPRNKAAFLKLARDRFKQADEANKNQRQRELDDLRFYAGDQWPSDIKAARSGEGLSDGLPPVPARPCLTINKTREPVRQVLNQERGADMGIEIVPADDFGEIAEPIAETEIQLREGLTRRIQRESKASDARTWAFARATIAGQGYYGVMTRYVTGKTNDQEIYVHRFYNQSSVLLDPAHEQPDGSDSEWTFVGANVPWLRYKAEYGKRNGKANDLVSKSDDEWRTLGDEQPDWFLGEGDTRAVRVVDYYYVERVSRELCELPDGTLAWGNELPEGVKVPAEKRRTVIEKQIKWAKLDGCDDDVLDETDWPGPDMPIVKVLGEELQPYDKERRCEGMVRPMREPGQGFNAMVSKFVEVIALTPVPPIMMAEGQQEGFEAWYQAANTRTLPYLLYKQRDLEGNPVPTPPFPMPRNAPIEAIGAGMSMFDQALQDTSISDPSMGQTDSSVKSAKHANILREQSQQATSNYLDNLVRSMRYEAQIINNLLYPIYGRPGRLARIINGEGEAQTVLLRQPMVTQNGRPQPAPEGAQDAKTYTLTKDAQFNVTVKISRNYDTRRQQEATTIGELLGTAPALMTWFGDLFFKNQDGPGHTEMADRAKVMLDPKILAMIESKKQGMEIPPQVQAQLAQSQQQIQQLTQVAQQLQQQIQTDAVKEQAETQRAQAKLAADLELARVQGQIELEKARMDNATKLQIEEYKLRGAQMQAEIDSRERQLGAQQQAVSDEAGRQHESAEAAAARESTERQTAEGRDHEAMMAERAQMAQTGVE